MIHHVLHMLLIDDTKYVLERLDPDQGTVKIAWNLKKQDGTVYTVALGKFGYECDCGDAIFRDHPCKHIQACVESGLFGKK